MLIDRIGPFPVLARHSRSRMRCALRSGIKEEAAPAAGGQPRSRAHCVREPSVKGLLSEFPSQFLGAFLRSKQRLFKLGLHTRSLHGGQCSVGRATLGRDTLAQHLRRIV